MAVQVYLNFKGNCKEAVEYYAQVFKTDKPRTMLFGDMPADDNHPMPEERKNLVMHSEINIHGSTIMFSDTPPEMPFTLGNNITLIFNSKEDEEIKSVFGQLKEGGTVIMELQETFWSKNYGYVIDKFGIGWQISHETEH